MSRNAEVTLTFADGDYRFRLPWGQLIQLQEKCDAGPPEIMARLLSNLWRVHEISETIRLGLIGGGLEPKKALKLVREYVEARPLMENLEIAQRVLGAAMVGVADEPPGESVGEDQAAASTTSPTEKSDSPPSTAGVQ